MQLDKVREVLAELPWEDLRATYDALRAAGESPGKAASAVARLADDLVDFADLVRGPAGTVLEAVDYAVIRAGVLLGIRFALSHSAKGT